MRSKDPGSVPSRGELFVVVFFQLPDYDTLSSAEPLKKKEGGSATYLVKVGSQVDFFRIIITG